MLTIFTLGNDPGYDCGFGGTIWNNEERDPAMLLDPSGREASRYE